MKVLGAPRPFERAFQPVLRFGAGDVGLLYLHFHLAMSLVLLRRRSLWEFLGCFGGEVVFQVVQPKADIAPYL